MEVIVLACIAVMFVGAVLGAVEAWRARRPLLILVPIGAFLLGGGVMFLGGFAVGILALRGSINPADGPNPGMVLASVVALAVGASGFVLRARLRSTRGRRIS